MLTVSDDVAGVERLLSEGRVVCPVVGCSRPLSPWGWARTRWVRLADGRQRVRPRRACCSSCSTTHVLLPVVMLARRADVVTVIGAAISAAAAGESRRRIAAIVDRPLGTVRSWLRRFDDRCEQVRAFFTRLLRDVAPDPVVPQPAGSVGADAVAAIGVAAQAIADRFSVSTLTPWRVAAAASHGQLLAPGWQPESINTSSLWAMLF